MLKQYTPLSKLTPDEIREYQMRVNALTEGQRVVILSTGKAVQVEAKRPTKQILCG